MRYPTKLLKPKTQSRFLREVVWRDMEELAQYRRRVDVPLVAESVHIMYRRFSQVSYSVPEFLRVYEQIDKARTSEAKRLTVDMVPWEAVPVDMLERCMDENYELKVTDELRRFLDSGFRSSEESIFERVEFQTRYCSGSTDNLIKIPVYNKRGKKVQTQYAYFDEKLGDFRRVVINRPRVDCVEATDREVSYVVDMFREEDNGTGISRRLLAQTIWSLYTCALEYRKSYYEQSYLERLITKTPEELRYERAAGEKEYALSRRGNFCEDTSVLWGYGQLSD